MSQLKKLSALLAITVTGLFASAACMGPVEEPTNGDGEQVSEAQEAASSQSCRNTCIKEFCSGPGFKTCNTNGVNGCFARCKNNP
jgi:hypothetical protein